jgi:hypothetical protein
MKQIFLFLFSIVFAFNSFGQSEFNSKFKAIPPQNIKPKPKKETLPPPTDLPKIVAPNVFKETNIFGTKPKPNNSFEIGTPENHFTMTPKNKFEHKLGDVYQDKMTKDLDKTMVREGLKEDSNYLVKIDVDFGVIRTKSKYFVIKFRDYGAIDGDLIKADFNDSTVLNDIQLESSYQEFRIYFNEGFNILKLEALNRGLLGGNTGEFQIYDAEGKFIRSDYWNNWDVGVKGIFKIYKE